MYHIRFCLAMKICKHHPTARKIQILDCIKFKMLWKTRNDDSPKSFYSIITFWNVCKGIASFDWHKANMKFYYMILYHFNSQRGPALYYWYQLFSVSPRKKNAFLYFVIYRIDVDDEENGDLFDSFMCRSMNNK